MAKTFHYDSRAGMHSLNEFVIDTDSLENWAKNGQLDKVILNTFAFYKELQEHPAILLDNRFLEEFENYLNTVNSATKEGTPNSDVALKLNKLLTKLISDTCKVRTAERLEHLLSAFHGILKEDGIKETLRLIIQQEDRLTPAEQNKILSLLCERNTRRIPEKIKQAFESAAPPLKTKARLLKEAYDFFQNECHRPYSFKEVTESKIPLIVLLAVTIANLSLTIYATTKKANSNLTEYAILFTLLSATIFILAKYALSFHVTYDHEKKARKIRPPRPF